MSQKIKEIIVATAEFFRVQMSPSVLSMYYEDLADLPEDEVLAAYKRFRRNPANRQNPLPAQIRELVSPEEFISPQVLARETAARIIGAVTMFGWNNGRAAAEYIGQEGWAAVQRQGGWSHICENLGLTIQPTTFQAQLRDQLEGSFKYGTSTIEHALGALPESTRGSSSLERIDFTKMLTPKEDPA